VLKFKFRAPLPMHLHEPSKEEYIAAAKVFSV